MTAACNRAISAAAIPARSIRHIALLASASVLSIMTAGHAQAQCVTTPNQPPNAITADGTTMFCTGTVNGQVFTATADSVVFEANGPNTFVTGASIDVQGNNSAVLIRNGAVLNGSLITLDGTANTLYWSSTSNGSIINVTGANSQLVFDTGSQVTQNPGQTTISAAPGEQNMITISSGGGLFTTGANGQYLLTGGTGNQTVTISGFLSAPGDGLAIHLGDGDDRINIAGSASILGGTNNNIIFEGGAGDDTFFLSGSGPVDYSTSGFETLIVNSTGTSALNGIHASATRVELQSGTTVASGNAALGTATSTIDIGQFAGLDLNFAASASFNHSLTGAGTLAIDSAGQTLIFGGDGSAYSGAVSIANGSTANLANATALGTGAIANNGVLGTGDFNLANDISGTGQVIKTGSGTGDLSGNNSFSGGLDIQGGSIRVANVGALGTGFVTSSTGGAILQLENTNVQTLANDLTGNLVLVKTDGGELTLTGNNSYAGGTLIDTGAVRVDDFARLGTGQVITNANGSLILNYAGAGQLLQTTTFLSGTGRFIKEGSGDVVMDLVSTYSGGTVIRAGRLGLNDGDALGTGAIQIDAGAELGIGGIILNNTLTGTGLVRKTANNTAELYGDNSLFAGTIQVEDGDVLATSGAALGSGTLRIDTGASVFVNASADSVLAANLSGGGTFEKVGTGRLTVTGNGTQFGGAIAIQGGVLQIAGQQNIGTSAGGVFINSQGTLQLDTAGNTNLATVIYGSGNVIKTGSGTVFMTGNNTYSGGTDIQAGALRVTNTGVLGTGAITVQQGAALDLAIAGAQTLNQSVTGAGMLRKSDAGDLTLLGNGLTGGVDIVEGRVIVGNAAALGGGGVTTAAGTALVFDNAATELMTTPISGAGSLIKNGAGRLVISNANSFTGGTMINAGRLGLNDGQALGSGDIQVASGAILGVGGIVLNNRVTGTGEIVKTSNNAVQLLGDNSGFSGTIRVEEGVLFGTSGQNFGTGSVQLDTGTSFQLGTNTDSVLVASLTGTGNFEKLGTGTITLAGNNGQFAGSIGVTGGALRIASDQNIGTQGVFLGSAGSLQIETPVDTQIASGIFGSGNLIKSGAGRALLTNAGNSYSGGTQINQGVLAVSDPGALGSGAVTIGSGTSLALDYSGAANVALANALTGSGSLIKQGSGIVVINAGGNSYTGGTSIEAGRLTLNFGDGLGTGPVTIAAGAELGLGGVTLANTVTGAGRIVKTGGLAATLTGQNSHTGGIDIQGGSVDVNGNAALGSGTVSIASGASLNYSNAAAATFSNGLSGAGSFVKSGTGQLGFANNFGIGALNLMAGRTLINVQASSNVTVGSNATLDGTGRIIGNLTNNGLIAPGNSIGTLTVQGNYTHASTGILEIEFDAAGNIDLLDVTGNANINGGTLRFVSIGGAEGQGGTFLRTGGTLTGTFATVETVGALLPLAVIYQPNSAIMAPSVLTARPSTFNAQALAAADTTLGFIDSLGVAAGRHGRGNRLWLNSFGAWGKRSASGATLGYDHDVYGMSGGINTDIADDITIGAAIGWAKGDIALSANGGGGDQ